jgi:DNA primase
MSTTSGFSMHSEGRRRLLTQATTEYAECVDLARTYLRGRGLTDEVIDRWQLGCVLDPLPGHERWHMWLSIPYLTKNGPAEMKFRCIRDECDHSDHGKRKYDSEKGAKTLIFGAMSFWKDSRFICVTEGELDAIACDVAGLPAVGISGATKWLSHWQYCFEGYEEVIVLADGDQAGEKLASNVLLHVHNGRVITFPKDEDVNSFLIQHGPQALRQKVLGHE